MLFLIQKEKGGHTALGWCFGVVVCVRFADSLLLTASVVEDAYRHLNGTARPFYRTVADIKHYLLDSNKKNRPNHTGLGLLNT